MRGGLVQADDATALADVVRDPVRFCLGLLRQDLWPLQEAILRTIAPAPGCREGMPRLREDVRRRRR